MLKELIKYELSNRQLSIRQLCLSLEIREASVSEFLSGKRKNIGIKNLEKILNYLEIIK